MHKIKNILAFIILLFISSISFAQKEKNPVPEKITKSNNKLTEFDSSFIGKTTDDKYIDNLFDCWGTMIPEGDNEKEDSLAISGIAQKIEKCNMGKFKILFEKMLFRNVNGRAVFKITDELVFVNSNPKIKVSTVRLKLKKDKKAKTYLVKFMDYRKPYVENFLAIWEIDLKNMKFIPLKIREKIKFYTPDYID